MKQSFKKYAPEVILHVLFWILVFAAISSLTTLTIKYLENFHGLMDIRILKNSLYPLSFILLCFLVLLFYINSFWLCTVLAVKKYYRVLASIGLTIILYASNYFLVNKLIIFSTLTADQWVSLQINISLLFTFIWGFSLAYFFSKEWFKNLALQKKIEANQLTTELNFLKSQINPHFLFNTLNNLFSMAQEKENDELANGIARLSEMMRYMIYESNAEKVPLEKEIEYLKSLIVLNKLRFDENEVKVNFSYPESCKGEMIAPMLFIPFVENAFKYGIWINERSEINIMIKLSAQGIEFSCDNNDYSSLIKQRHKDGIGLYNVQRRLALIYPDRFALKIDHNNKKHSVLLQLYKQ